MAQPESATASPRFTFSSFVSNLTSENTQASPPPAPPPKGLSRKAKKFLARQNVAWDAWRPEIPSEAYGERHLSRPPVWLESARGADSPSKSLVDRLDSEIRSLVDWLSPSAQEVDLRNATVAKYRNIVKAIDPSFDIFCFGSFPTNMYLPNADIDITILIPNRSNTRNKQANALVRVKRHLQNRQVGEVTAILHARVPILKVQDRETGLILDISCHQDESAAQSVHMVQEAAASYPQLRPIVMFLKLYLGVRDLTSVPTGGLGGFALVCWVLTFLQMHPAIYSSQVAPPSPPKAAVAAPAIQDGSREQPASESAEQTAAREHTSASAPQEGAADDRGQDHTSGRDVPRLTDNLGELVTDFFHLFGKVFDYFRLGLVPTGHVDPQSGELLHIISKETSDLKEKRCFFIQNPTAPVGTNLCKGTYKIDHITASFYDTYELLMAMDVASGVSDGCDNELELHLRRARFARMPKSKSVLAHFMHMPPDISSNRKRPSSDRHRHRHRHSHHDDREHGHRADRRRSHHTDRGHGHDHRHDRRDSRGGERHDIRSQADYEKRHPESLGSSSRSDSGAHKRRRSEYHHRGEPDSAESGHASPNPHKQRRTWAEPSQAQSGQRSSERPARHRRHTEGTSRSPSRSERRRSYQ
ncbi:uncharacterized protein BJ171DRAFT_516854 [Polychytrium aggregatum]|uniref:uncharacterized protein n=1 Tax=Polychytrium aggregatum TaxID=110093 RepID=UPI0022FEC792|nr:uncharacterized protein BJ171DRAFT_516854 [Polychytrium aggregatum]KAI9201898.1 hypothetical protein BJ171DRAFT_516854 [Polychytrium aggregatum]